MRDKHLIYIEINATNNHGTPQPAVFMRDKECLQYRGEEWWEAGHDNDEVIFEQEDDVENGLGGTHTSIAMSFPKMPETHGCQTIGDFKDGDNVRLRCGHVIIKAVENAYAVAPFNHGDGYWGDLCEKCFSSADLVSGVEGEWANHQFRTPAEQEMYDDRAMLEDAGVVPSNPVDLLAENTEEQTGDAYGIAIASKILSDRDIPALFDEIDDFAEFAIRVARSFEPGFGVLFGQFVQNVADGLHLERYQMDDNGAGAVLNEILEEYRKPVRRKVSCNFEIELPHHLRNAGDDEIEDYIFQNTKVYMGESEVDPDTSLAK